MREFHSPAEAARFARDQLNVQDMLRPEVRSALRAFHDRPDMINNALRLPSISRGIRAWVATRRESFETVEREGGLDAAAGRLARLNDQLDQVRGLNLDDFAMRMVRQIEETYEEESLEYDNALLYQEMAEFYREHFGDPARSPHRERPEPFGLPDHIDLLNEVTSRRLPLNEPIRLRASIWEIGLMAPPGPRGWEALVGDTGRTTGFLRAGVGIDPPRSGNIRDVRLELEVPPGARGVYMGGDDPDRDYVLLAPDTRYVFDRVVRDDDGVTVVHARVTGPFGPVREMGGEPLPPALSPRDRLVLRLVADRPGDSDEDLAAFLRRNGFPAMNQHSVTETLRDIYRRLWVPADGSDIGWREMGALAVTRARRAGQLDENTVGLLNENALAAFPRPFDDTWLTEDATTALHYIARGYTSNQHIAEALNHSREDTFLDGDAMYSHLSTALLDLGLDDDVRGWRRIQLLGVAVARARQLGLLNEDVIDGLPDPLPHPGTLSPLESTTLEYADMGYHTEQIADLLIENGFPDADENSVRETLHNMYDPTATPVRPDPAPVRLPAPELTALHYLARGYTGSEHIAEALRGSTAPDTTRTAVDNSLRRVMDRFGVHTPYAAMARAYELGILDDDAIAALPEPPDPPVALSPRATMTLQLVAARSQDSAEDIAAFLRGNGFPAADENSVTATVRNAYFRLRTPTDEAIGWPQMRDAAVAWARQEGLLVADTMGMLDEAGVAALPSPRSPVRLEDDDATMLNYVARGYIGAEQIADALRRIPGHPAVTGDSVHSSLTTALERLGLPASVLRGARLVQMRAVAVARARRLELLDEDAIAALPQPSRVESAMSPAQTIMLEYAEMGYDNSQITAVLRARGFSTADRYSVAHTLRAMYQMPENHAAERGFL